MKLPAALALGLLVGGCARDASAPSAYGQEDSAQSTRSDAGRPATDATAPVGTGDSEPADTGAADPDPDAGATPEDGGGPAPSACSGTAPPAMVDLGSANITAVDVGGAGNVATVAPGESVQVAFTYTLTIEACATIALPTISARIGFERGATACSDLKTCLPPSTQSVTLTLDAPTAPGEYGVYGALEHGAIGGFGSACGKAFSPVPDEAARIATLCVQ